MHMKVLSIASRDRTPELDQLYEEQTMTNLQFTLTETATDTTANRATEAYPIEVAPMDQFNRALLDNARPIHWRNPKPAGRYNLVVIGSGTAGSGIRNWRRRSGRQSRVDREEA